ncbi:MAG: hypothetical protein KIT40_14175 [Nitrospira sp.]|nr:hypothetical protein [Nitrospira sp.]
MLLCLTGLPLIFGKEVNRWTSMAVEPLEMAAHLPRADLDVMVADARARRPHDHVQFVSQDDGPTWFVFMGETPDALEQSRRSWMTVGRVSYCKISRSARGSCTSC